jgi:hypothetical protein
MDLGWKWLIPATLVNIVLTAIAVTLVQALDGWNNWKTIDSTEQGLNLTWQGKIVMIAFGFGGLFVTAAVLSAINWRSRDFNLKTQRRNIQLVNLPKGESAVATTKSAAAPATSEG